MSSNVEHARVLRQLKRYADAEAALQAHLADAPEDAEALSLLAQTLFQLKRYEEAIETGRSAVAADPRSAQAYWALGLVLVGKFHDTEGIDVLNRGLALGPDLPGLWELRGLAHLHLKRYTEALHDADEALRLEPTRKVAGTVRAGALRGLDRTDEAEQATRTVLANDPTLAIAHLSLANNHLARREYIEARAAFRDALRLDPNSVTARTGLAATLPADHRLYGLLLRYNLWYAKRSKRFHKVAGFGSLLIPLLVSQITLLPPLAHAALLACAMMLAGLIWMGPTWKTFILLADPFGRMVNTPREQREALALAACLLLGISLGIVGALTAVVGPLVLLPLFILVPVFGVKKLRVRSGHVMHRYAPPNRRTNTTGG